MTPYIDSYPAFGYAVKMKMVPSADAHQESEFFGVNGRFTLYGGSRGRAFLIKGVLVGEGIADVNQAETTLLSYADGLGHTILDTRGRTWQNVVFYQQYEPDDMGPRPGCWPDGSGGFNFGYCLPYQCVMEGLL